MQVRPNILQQTLETAITFLYPAQCRVCEKQIGLESVPYMCDACWDDIPLIEPPWCEMCGIPNAKGKCDACATTPPPYGKLRTIAFYESALQQAIHLFKFEKRTSLAKPLAQLTMDYIPDDCDITDYDFILPIPIHKKRLRERGFNQATLLANGIAKNVGIQVVTDALVRHRNTSPQSSLDREARQTNIVGAFELQKKEIVRNKRILVLDDVFTTGATVREAVKVLWDVDPIEVDVLTLARALNP
ncbi:MAG: ComF family protein [Candidatus Poribacteria bacterium]|nr:ComF family protein [Candidatus Poribacteria bacterium]